MDVYVLLLTFFLQGGTVMTHAWTSPTRSVCEQIKPLMVQDYLHGVQHLGNTDLRIEHIVPLCIKVSSD